MIGFVPITTFEVTNERIDITPEGVTREVCSFGCVKEDSEGSGRRRKAGFSPYGAAARSQT
jgi:hypothetical protein